ncbi:PoNe immunity protein domain-containing protein [Aquimarina agarilytica]|uniref:PoNe immunity protein domain-containing protein n=1 Tax=Aquimarina agarilytica TaxID=1087449 RepID=UPI0002892362|nr:PoNe immunity protein domain-containing protein [Aquimarina agarilytica]
MRDNLKNETYFFSFINEKQESINKRNRKLETNSIKEDRIVPVKKVMSYTYWQIANAKYSLGTISFTELQADLSKGITLLHESLINNNGKVHVKEDIYRDQYYVNIYQEILQNISLTCLLNQNDQDFGTIVGIIDRDNISDNLLEFIIKSKFKNRNNNRPEEYDQKHSIVLKVYDKLRKAIEQKDKSEASKLVKQFLEEDFYNEHSNCYELQNKTYNAYYGCWSFEAAAIVKIMGLDDSSFIDNQYYPKDLVHPIKEKTKKKGLLGKLGF